MTHRLQVLIFCLPVFLAACGSQSPRLVVERGAGSDGAVLPAPTFRAPPAVTAKRGGYYKDDGPGDNPPANIEAIPDAIPRLEPLHRFANNDYEVFGKRYSPFKQVQAYKENGIASWYGRKFHGQKTSSGELYDMYGMTAAHPTLPIPSYVRVTNKLNNKSIVVRVNDRGPFHSDRLIDLSWVAAYKLGYLEQGSAEVEVESVMSGQVLANSPAIDQKPGMAGQAEALAADAAAIEPAGKQPGTQRYFIQLGAFGQRGNADAFSIHMKSELAELSNKLAIYYADGLFRVQLGPWADRLAAQEASQKVRDKLNNRVVVVQR